MISHSSGSDYPQSESDCSDMHFASTTPQTKGKGQVSRPLPSFLFKTHANQMKMIRRMSSSVLFGMSSVNMTEKDFKKPKPPPSLLSRGYEGARRNS